MLSPGVSSTVILMILGVYSTYLSALSIVNMTVLLPIMIGAGIGSFIFMKIIQKLLNKYHSQTIFGEEGQPQLARDLAFFHADRQGTGSRTRKGHCPP